MPHSVASDLGLHCLPMSHKKDARIIWDKVSEYSIGIKHDFLCINIFWPRGLVLYLEPERQGFSQPPWRLADVNVSEKIVDCCYFIKSFCCLELLKITIL